MTQLGHGHGQPHEYVTAGEDDPRTKATTLGHGHGTEHAYVTRSPKTAVEKHGLSDEDRVSVAENVMEDAGHTGRQWHVPAMHQDDPARVEAHRPVHEFVNQVLNENGHPGGIRVHPRHWDLRAPGSGQATTDGMNYIGLAGDHTHDLTLLHEITHILTGTGEGRGGHGPAFQDTAHRLYQQHLGPEAAETFARLTPPASRRMAAADESPSDLEGDDAIREMAKHGIEVHDQTPVFGLRIGPNRNADADPKASLKTFAPDHPLHSAQTFVHFPAVREYVEHGHDWMPYPHPEVARHGGKDWILGGHHRIIASRIRGEPITVWHRDLDAEMRGKNAKLGRTATSWTHPQVLRHEDLDQHVGGYEQMGPVDRKHQPYLSGAQFHFHPSFPLKHLDHYPAPPEELAEDDEQEEHYHGLQHAIMNRPHDVPPIIVVQHPTHHQILDGNHRVSLALEADVSHLPAYVYRHNPGKTAAVGAPRWQGPHQFTLHLAQRQIREKYPELAERLPTDAYRPLRKVLRAGGHPDTADAFVVPHRDPLRAASQTVFGPYGEPGVALHPDRWDHGTVAHEGAHHLHIYHGRLDSTQNPPDEIKHGPDFVEHYRTALNAIAAPAGDELHEAYHAMLPKKLDAANGPLGRALYGVDRTGSYRTAGHEGKVPATHGGYAGYVDHDDDLWDFTLSNAVNPHFWQHHAPVQPVSLKQPIHATQPYLVKAHVDRYLQDPASPRDQPTGSEHPMMVKHENRVHVLEGHHRVAAELLRGSDSINAHYFDADKHGFPPGMDGNEEYRNSPWGRVGEPIHHEAKRKTAVALPQGDDLYWRFHHKDAPFGPEHTRSYLVKAAVRVGPGYHREYPETWGDEYHAYASDKPHAAAVGQAQEHVRAWGHYVWGLPLGSGENASEQIQHLLRKAGHPDADGAFVVQHAHPEKGTSNTVHDPVTGEIGAALHPSRWDYGTLAHETAHLTHQHELGVTSGKGLSDEELHGPGFVEHYKRHAEALGRGMGDELHEAYNQARQRIRGAAGHKEGKRWAADHQHDEMPQDHPFLRRQGAAFTPHERIFGPTHGLDHRLFDGDHLKPDVRDYILKTLSGFWTPLYGPSWRQWAKVYFAGSEASEWTSETLEGNNDFDVLIGVDYGKMRADLAGLPGLGKLIGMMTDEQITNGMNTQFRDGLNPRTEAATITIDGKPEGLFSNTWYVNKDSHDIRVIRPYAAYDVIDDSWAVRPPHLPDWDISQFPEGKGLVKEIHGIIEMAKGILAMPEPHRTQNGAALWEFVHSNRSNAFGPQGEGWFDARNVIEKALDQAGLMQKLWTLMDAARQDPATLSSPARWSNDPASAEG